MATDVSILGEVDDVISEDAPAEDELAAPLSVQVDTPFKIRAFGSILLDENNSE